MVEFSGFKILFLGGGRVVLVCGISCAELVEDMPYL